HVNTTSITTNGTQTYNDAVVLGSNATFSNDAGDVVLNSTVDGDGTAARTLTVNTAGNATFAGDVGGSVALADLDATATTINLNASTFNVNGATVADTVTFTGALVLGADVTINTDGTVDNSVKFAGAVNADDSTSADRKLVVTSGSGNVTFGA